VTESLAIVTGSTNNIGQAIAQKLSEDGYHVVVTSRHQEDATTVASELPSRAFGFEVDFSVPDDISDLFEFVDELDGQLSVLVNNVARTDNQSVLECDLETWNETIDTNLRSYFLCTREAAKRMKEHGKGVIINVTVSITERSSDSKFAYLTSKGGVDSMTKTAALDLAPHGIRVNAVGSGLVGTPVGTETMQHRDRENPRIPIGRIGDPAELAAAVSFLVSDESSFVVGAKLPVDGGMFIN
jgi:NAD(P)-dependent dehydrogenase (short-subunit alcohol dehydrogenase family)